jgi:hypothetical protein
LLKQKLIFLLFLDASIDIYTCGVDGKRAHCKNDSSIKYFLSIGDLVYDESSSNNIIKLQELLDNISDYFFL